ncbi:ABC transporter ATP-binding protein [Pseudomonas sp. R3.Fl]|uniref:ABC transporter ATP-binding protein n=1 Tax=Pseudomonas TaxID=286 RepID=UPI00201DCC98|nr:ABC transporter ATP-binding protein [Pseudomonas sp. R3.Fl]MCL6692311.1 ABC transporter ATP-binding protein [Pseudomonas sp. R3.Fl]
MSRVILNDLRKAFDGRVNAIRQLDLQIEAGEFFVLLGPSGCGKTTTLRCIAGLEEPDGGQVRLGERVVADAGSGLFVVPEQRHIGMVFQNYALWPHMTVRQNVAYPLKTRGRLGEEEQRRILEVLQLVGLDGHAERYPAELSGGQQQRVALARALVARPGLMLFDEPLSNMDAQLRIRLRQDLRRIHDELGYTAVYVTHDHAEALALADRVAVMNAGRLEQVGTPGEIFLAPRTRFVADFVGIENILPGRIDALDGDQAQVSLEQGGLRLVVRNPSRLPPGAPVWIALRAAQLQALPTGHGVPAQALTLHGVVSEATYAGDRYTGQVEALGLSLAVTLGLDAWGSPLLGRDALVGQAVRVALQPGAALAIPREAASEPLPAMRRPQEALA